MVKNNTEIEQHNQIQKMTPYKLMQQEMKLLAEWSCDQAQGGCHYMAKNALGMAALNKELLKTECIGFMKIIVVLLSFFHLLKRFHIKGIQLIRG